jgi:AcrR family transcriptional regulator
VNLAMISYHFGGKEGLYTAVVEEQFARLRQMAEVARMDISPTDKFRSYLYQCGICFHQGSGDEFRPSTASADPAVPECPRCLNNDAESFALLRVAGDQAA